MRRRIGSAASRGRARGSSFIELLVALTVLALMMIGTLQLFSLSLAVNKGASARTEMLLRCQQVVENIRYITYLNKKGFATPANTGVPYPLPNTIGPPYKLPYLGTEPEYPYWGPDGANVITGARGPYKIFYFIESDNGTSTGMHVVTVTAVPAGSTEDPFTPPDPLPISKYFGVGPSRHLRVDYVAQF